MSPFIHKQNAFFLKSETMTDCQAMNQVGTAYLRDTNCVLSDKKFYNLMSFPGNFNSRVVSDSFDIPPPLSPPTYF